MAIPTALFLAVYLGCMSTAARLLRGPARWPLPAGAATLFMLGYCGWALAFPVVVTAAALRRRHNGRRVPGSRVPW